MRVAAVNWELCETDSIDQFFDHCNRLVAQCDGAELVVMPEYTSLELLGRRPDLPQESIAAFLADLLSPHFGRFAEIASSRSCTLVAGTHFFRTSRGVANSAIVALPDGSITADVPKVVMTQFEKAEWGIVAGDGLRSLPDSRIGVTVCYDCEFPGSGRLLAENGMLVQSVPAYTETVRGFNRVRWGCLARALENQIFVVHSSLVGSLEREPVPATYGSSAVLAPCVEPFPEDAVLAETPRAVEAVAVANLDFEALQWARDNNDVRNWHDRNQEWRLNEASWSRSSKP